MAFDEQHHREEIHGEGLATGSNEANSAEQGAAFASQLITIKLMPVADRLVRKYTSVVEKKLPQNIFSFEKQLKILNNVIFLNLTNHHS